MERKYTLKNLNCAHCASKIEKKAASLEGVTSVKLDFLNKTLSVSSDISKENEIRKIIKKIEPDVKIISEKDDDNNETNSINILFITGIIFFIVALFIKTEASIRLFVIAYFLIGYKVIIKAIKNIFNLQPLDENFLMFVATIGAFIIGEYPEAVAVMLFYYIGEFFQDKAVNKARKQIADLTDIKPEYATLISKSGETKVSPEKIKKDDIIKVKAGEKIPLDGIVIKGTGNLDTKALTGESLPIPVKKDSKVLSGSINLDGVIFIRVTEEYKNSTVAKILKLMETASSEKTKTENFITEFAKIYTPIVVASAILIAIIPPLFTGFSNLSDWIYKGLVFLVVSCPCALVISVPLGYFGGLGNASSKGILIKGSNYLDVLSKLDLIVFDKTGTLTTGEFSVSAITSFEMEKNELLKIAAYGEANSNHPIAQAVIKAYGKEINIEEVSDFSEIAGCGISFKLNGKEAKIGNSKLIEVNEEISDNTLVHIIYDGKYSGYIEFEDKIKEDAKKAVEELHNIKISTAMLTGDKKSVALKVADKLKLKEAYYELLPTDKVEILRQLKKKSKNYVAFAGDGINDAPALKISDAGFSMGSLGSDAAIEASDIVISNDNPMLIPKAVKIAKKTKRIVTQNIIFSLGIKFLVLLLTLFSLTNLWIAVFADVGVALIAILNSLRALKD